MIYRHNKQREDRLLKWLKELRLNVNPIYLTLSSLYDLDFIVTASRDVIVKNGEVNKFDNDDLYEINDIDNSNSIEVASHNPDHSVRVNPSQSLDAVNVVVQRGEIVEMTSGYVTMRRVHVKIEECMRETREKTNIYHIKKSRKRFL